MTTTDTHSGLFLSVEAGGLDHIVEAGVATSTLSDEGGAYTGVSSEASAGLIHLALSRHLGSSSGWREDMYKTCLTLAGIANLPTFENGLYLPGGSQVDTVAPPPEGIPLNGWPTGKTAMKAMNLRPLELDSLWGEQVALYGDFALLPLSLVQEFAPPAIWPMLESCLHWGPFELAERCRRYFLLAAQGKAPNCGQLTRATIGGRVTCIWRWMGVLQGVARSKYGSHVPPELAEALDGWTVLPAKIKPKTLNAKPSKRDRSAPDLEAVRLAYHDLETAIGQKRARKDTRATMFELLKSRALLHLFAHGSRSEPIAAMSVADIDFVGGTYRLRELKGQRVDTADGVWKPAPPKLLSDLREYMDYVGVTNSKGHVPLDQLDPNVYGMQPLPSPYVDQPREAAMPLWVSGRRYFLEATGEPVSSVAPFSKETRLTNAAMVGRGVEARPDPRFPDPQALSKRISNILAPYTPERKSGHTLRHLAEKLAQEGARDYLETHREPAYITPDVIARSLLDHQMPGGISATYSDLEQERGRLALIAANAISEFVTGDRGARLGLDEDRILSSKQQMQETQSALTAARLTVRDADEALRLLHEGKHELHAQIEALRREKNDLRAKVLEDGHSLTEREYRRHEQQIKQIDDALDEIRDKVVALQFQLTAELAEANHELVRATGRVFDAEEKLRVATEARLPLSPGSEPGDLELRLQELLTGITADDRGRLDFDEVVLSRSTLTTKEYSRVMGIPHSTMRKYIQVASESPDGFPFAGGASNYRNPWFQPIHEILEVHSERKRYFNFDALDLSHYTPGQISAMKHALSSPAHNA